VYVWAAVGGRLHDAAGVVRGLPHSPWRTTGDAPKIPTQTEKKVSPLVGNPVILIDGGPW